MKKYVEKIERWKIFKALGYLSNFFKNHQGSVNDDDIFKPLTDLMENVNWEKKIREVFPAATVKRMESIAYHRRRLDFTDSPQDILRQVWDAPFARKKIRQMLISDIAAIRNSWPQETLTGEMFPRKLAEIQQTFSLSDFEVEVMTVLALVRNDTLTVIDGHTRRSDENDKAVFVAKCLDCEVAAVMATLNCKEKLRRYHCVDEDFDFNHRLFEFLNGVSDQPLSHNYFRLCQEESLPWEFYGSLAEKHGKLIKDILRCRQHDSSNILLYGAPGTGKTSFAKTLADQLGKKCYIIAQDTKERDRATSSPEYRFAALQICDSQVEPDSSVIIVDEADEMLSGGSAGMFSLFFGGMDTAKGDKGMLNDVLDHIKSPTIWITNTPAEALDESSRRRFDYSVKFEPLNAVQRKNIWHNNIKKMHLEALIDDDMTAFFAERYNVNAGIITKVLGNVQKMASTPAEVKPLMEKLLAQHCELLDIKVDEKLQPAKDYSLAGLNIKGELDLEKIIAACRKFQHDDGDAPDRPRMNLLLSGPPGTGKTEFVKYLGKMLDTRVVVKMGSDLLSMYVGGTEQNIKAAFREAESNHAILFLDEIDGLLQSRERAQRSWEVTQVNELLYQMENFNGILIGATNFAANLDPATLRRFTFKIGFDYLDIEGKKLFFERMFQSGLTAGEAEILAAIPNLAPGDFRTVRQSLYYLDGQVTNRDRLAALAAESKVKRGNKNCQESRIGF